MLRHLRHLKVEEVENVASIAAKYRATLPEEASATLAEVEEQTGDEGLCSALVSVISALSNPQRGELCALMWLGREDGSMDVDDFDAVAREQVDIHPDYLVGKTRLAEYLRRGLQIIKDAVESGQPDPGPIDER